MLNLQELSDKGILFDGHYRLLYPLSTDGATADVWLAIDYNTIDSELGEEEEKEKNEETGMKVAIKIYRPKNALDIEGEQRFRDEYKIVYECRHANLLQPTGFSIFGENPYLVLPFCENGSSEKLIGEKLSEDEIWKYILDVASGLNRLHTNDPQIIHQDIKPANILIDNMHNYAITDFGISSRKGGVHGYLDEENSGTLAYMAPERFHEEEPKPQSDIWAFGATLFEILTGEVPFGENGGKAQRPEDPIPSVQGVPMAVNRLIGACLDYNPDGRPTARDLAEAAQYKQFPLKHRKWLWASLVTSIVLLIGFGILWSVILKPIATNSQKVSIEDMYSQAFEMMESTDTSIFLKGYHIMDSLSNEKYIPAMIEIAFTHGWYPDSASLYRKDVLGIKYEQSEGQTLYMPLDNNDNQKAMYLMSEILKQCDSNYEKINGYAAYQLALYYINEGTYIEKNDKNRTIALNYLKEAQKWAEISKDSILLAIIEKGINDI